MHSLVILCVRKHTSEAAPAAPLNQLFPEPAAPLTDPANALEGGTRSSEALGGHPGQKIEGSFDGHSLYFWH
uniref:Protein-tyrosine-phosphatase n=1 Tax=Steinernema glaseri TaxID=37863 RepID=A0A1I7ZX01_9BILA